MFTPNATKPSFINITQTRSSTRLKMKRNVMISLEKNAKHMSCLKVLSIVLAYILVMLHGTAAQFCLNGDKINGFFEWRSVSKHE